MREFKGFSMSLKVVMILVMGVIAVSIAIAMLTNSTGGLENLSNTTGNGTGGGFV